MKKALTSEKPTGPPVIFQKGCSFPDDDKSEVKVPYDLSKGGECTINLFEENTPLVSFNIDLKNQGL